MKKIFTCLCLLALVAGRNELYAANATVVVSDNEYTPVQVTINAGEMVTWELQPGAGAHPTRSDSSPSAWTTFTLDASTSSFSHTFLTAGTYPYHCTIHGQGMSGEITVLAAPTGTKEDQLTKPLFNIYPNPAVNKVKLQLNLTKTDNHEVRITNAIGKTVKTIGAAELKAVKETEIDLSDMPGGIYFYTLWNRNKMLDTRRLILAK